MIEHVEGFEGVDDVGLAARYEVADVAAGVTLVAGRPGGYADDGDALQWPDADPIVLQTFPFSPASEVAVSLAVRVDRLAKVKLLEFRSGTLGTPEQVAIHAIPVGTTAWRLEARSQLSVLGTSLPIANDAAAWRTLEARVLVDDEAGEIEVLVDQVRRLLLRKRNTDPNASGTIDNVQFAFQRDAAGDCAVDDVVVTSSNGDDTTRKGLLGEVKVLTLRPEDDGPTDTWTPSAAADHYDLLDEATHDGDATHVLAHTAGLVDLFLWPKTTSLLVSGCIVAVWAEAIVRGLIVGTGKLEFIARVGSSTAGFGGPKAVTGAHYRLIGRAVERCPAGSTSYPWTPSLFDATLFGFRSVE